MKLDGIREENMTEDRTSAADVKSVVAVSRIMIEIERKLRGVQRKSATKKRPSRYLYHYTTAAGLMGIVQTNTLWATNLSYMNDAQELTYGMSLFREYCLSRLKETPSGNEADILAELLNLLDSNAVSDFYACCFTVEDDQLSQWRGYASETVGYSLGFDLNELRQRVDVYGYHQRMIYDTDLQFELVRTSISSFFDQIAVEDENLSTGLITTISMILKTVVDYLNGSFKHRGFQEEVEQRILVREEQAKDKIKLRSKNGLIIPYIELKVQGIARLPIASVKVGPNNYPQIAMNGVEALLKNAGHTDAVVSHSDIPFRAF